jgi:hypothetical protein
MNGVIEMKFTKHGWMVTYVFESDYVVYQRNIEVKKWFKRLYLRGDFVIKPKHGFSLSPRALMGI